MKKQKDKNRAEITTLPILPGTLLICGTFLAGFLILVAALYYSGVVSLPPVLENLLHGGRGQDPESVFQEQFLASLEGNAPALDEADVRLLDLSPGELKTLLLACEPAQSSYQLADVIRTSGASVFSKTEVLCITSGARTHVEVWSSTRTVEKLVIANETEMYIREGADARHFSRTGEWASFTPQGEAGLPSLARMQRMIAEADEGKYELSLTTVLSSPCIRASFTDTLSGTREVFEVMPDTGLILNAASYLPGDETPYYQMQTTSVLLNLSRLDETIFDIPNP